MSSMVAEGYGSSWTFSISARSRADRMSYVFCSEGISHSFEVQHA